MIGGDKRPAEAGLYYFNARWYDPGLGRFITEDPIKDGVNWFAYANNNPLRYVDPTGLLTEDGIVEKDDTLSEIAETVLDRTGLDLSVEHLAKSNGIENPDKIYPGDKIDTIVPEVVERTTPMESTDPNLIEAEEVIAINEIITSSNPGMQMTEGAIQMGSAAVTGPKGFLYGVDGYLKGSGALAEMISATVKGEPVQPTPKIVGIESLLGPVVGAFIGDQGKGQEMTRKALSFLRGTDAVISGDYLDAKDIIE